MENSKLIEIIEIQSQIILKLGRKQIESTPPFKTPEKIEFEKLIETLEMLTKSI